MSDNTKKQQNVINVPNFRAATDARKSEKFDKVYDNLVEGFKKDGKISEVTLKKMAEELVKGHHNSPKTPNKK